MTAVELPADPEANTLDQDRTALIGVVSNQDCTGRLGRSFNLPPRIPFGPRCEMIETG
jgi:hypothetical protein